MWAVPWQDGEAVNTCFLFVATMIVVAVPIVYGIRANLRDSLARAVLAGTGATAIAFSATLIFTLAYHAGWSPGMWVWNWLTPAVYVAVALGKLSLLISLLRVLRNFRDVNQ